MTEPQVARDDFFDSLLGDFLDESSQLLDRLNENLLQLDEWVRSLGEDHRERCDEDLMNEMFRSAHSLKGLSAMLGLKDINDLTHKVENVFDAARKDQLVFSGDVVELMFQAIDRLVALTEALKDQDADPVECGPVLDGIRQVLQAAGVERQQSSQADAERALQDSPAEAASEAAAPEHPAAEIPAPACDETAAPVTEEEPEPAPIPAPVPAPQTAYIDVFAGIRDEAEICGKYLSIFIDEAELSLDELTETLLALEGGGSREALEKLLVTSHRIKGSAASVGLNRAAKLAHLMEDLLQTLVMEGGTLSPELTDAMLKCTDGLRQYVDALRKGRRNSDHFGDLARDLVAAQDAQPSSKREPEPAASTPEVPEPVAVTAEATVASSVTGPVNLRAEVARTAPEGSNPLVGEVTFRPDLPLVGLKAQLVFEKLSNLGEVCYFHPPVESLEEMEALSKVCFGLVTDKPTDSVQRYLRIAGVDQVVLEPLYASHVSEPPLAKSTADSPSAIAQEPCSAKPAKVQTPARAGAVGSKPETARQERPTRPASARAASPLAEEASTAARTPRPSASDKGESEDASGKGRTADGSKPTETLRVDIDRLDQLMNLAGQLVISKARFAQIADRFKAVLGNRQSSTTLSNVFGMLDRMAGTSEARAAAGHVQAELESVRNQARRIQNDLETVRRDMAAMTDVRTTLNDLFEAVHQLDRVTDGIQQSVMDTRMVPIGPLFSRFKRVVRDITRTNGKQVRLEINGEKTELDKRMIDELGDPLIHMVRNSADHGIELPEVREAAGKPREGTITLNAFHRGNSIFIQVTDDGKGLDADRILRKALEKGLVSPIDAEKLTPQQIYNLIWEPGLSTAEKVTEVSGRGMGMDIVKSKIEDLNGSIELDSAPGQGTTITIKLPLTLAILPSLMVEIDRDVFAMPIESVAEIVSVSSKDMTTVHGLWTARVRGRVISVVHLNELLAWNGADRTGSREGEETTLVIVGERGHEVGLAVNRVLGEEDVVIKSMAENYRNVAGIAGASILGDGRVSLILDVAALIEMASHKNLAATPA